MQYQHVPDMPGNKTGDRKNPAACTSISDIPLRRINPSLS